MIDRKHEMEIVRRETCELIEKAEAGSAEDLYLAGIMHEMGWGVLANQAKALDFHTQAAEMGNPDSQYRLGYMYSNGIGTGTDLEKGMAWLEKAALQGNEFAREDLGKPPLFKDGMSYDEQADLWKKAQRGDASAQFSIGIWMYMQNQEDHAHYWLTKASSQVHANAQVRSDAQAALDNLDRMIEERSPKSAPKSDCKSE